MISQWGPQRVQQLACCNIVTLIKQYASVGLKRNSFSIIMGCAMLSIIKIRPEEITHGPQETNMATGSL